MARDFFGRIIREDFLTGKKIPERQIKQAILKENKQRGKAAEDIFQMRAALKGEQCERSPHGRDFIVRKKDIFTGKVIKTTHVEVKSSKTAPLTPLQEKIKKRQSNYKVERIDPLW